MQVSAPIVGKKWQKLVTSSDRIIVSKQFDVHYIWTILPICGQPRLVLHTPIYPTTFHSNRWTHSWTNPFIKQRFVLVIECVPNGARLSMYNTRRKSQGDKIHNPHPNLNISIITHMHNYLVLRIMMQKNCTGILESALLFNIFTLLQFEFRYVTVLIFYGPVVQELFKNRQLQYVVVALSEPKLKQCELCINIAQLFFYQTKY